MTNPNHTFRLWRRIFCSFFFFAVAIAGVGGLAFSNAVGQRVEINGGSTSPKMPVRLGPMGQRVGDNPFHQKIAPWVMEHTANGQRAEFLVMLADQADLSPAANLPTKTEKGRFVYQTLLEKAQSTQEQILQWLRDRKIEHQSFYIVNAILVKGDRHLAETFAARPEGAHIDGNPLIHNELPQPTLGETAVGRPATIEPGIVYTHAPDV